MYYLSKSDWHNMDYVPEGMNLQMLRNEDRLDKVLKPAIHMEISNQCIGQFLDGGLALIVCLEK